MAVQSSGILWVSREIFDQNYTRLSEDNTRETGWVG